MKYLKLGSIKLFVGLFLIIQMGANAQQSNINFTEFDLNNGLHVILHQNNKIPLIAINILYHVGSKNETADRTGFAHFFEHLMFEGSDNIGRGEYFKYIQNAGGNNNAYTSFDQTVYHEVLPSNQLELGLWLESERMLHLKVDSIGIETQRKVVKEERRQSYENRPYGRLMLEIFKNSFTVSPYQWTPIGEAQYIDKATYNEFYNFYKKYYLPYNAVLVVTGDFQTEQAKTLIKKYFEEIPKGTAAIERPNTKEPVQNKEVKAFAYDKVPLPVVLYMYHTPAMGSLDLYALDMLQKWISGGKSSILYKSLVDQQQLSVDVGAFPYNLEDAGLFIAYCFANQGITAETMDSAMNKEIEKAKNSDISDHDFQKIKNQIENDFYSQNSSMAGIAGSLASYYTFYKNTNLINTEIEMYNKVTKEDIKRVAQKYLVPENRTVLYYLPESLKK